MTKPDVKQHNPNPQYMRALIAESGLSQAKVAQAIGHNERTMRYWLSGRHDFPYSVQYAIEKLIGLEAVKRARGQFSQ